MISENQKTIDETLNARDVLNELIENEEFLKQKEMLNSKVIPFLSRFQKCPRCSFESKTNLSFDYCPLCNWDKLTDPSFNNYTAELAA